MYSCETRSINDIIITLNVTLANAEKNSSQLHASASWKNDMLFQYNHVVINMAMLRRNHAWAYNMICFFFKWIFIVKIREARNNILRWMNSNRGDHESIFCWSRKKNRRERRRTTSKIRRKSKHILCYIISYQWSKCIHGQEEVCTHVQWTICSLAHVWPKNSYTHTLIHIS